MLQCPLHNLLCVTPTRIVQEQDSARAMHNQPYRLLERSIFCDRMVFVESLRDSNILSEMELSIYDSW